VISSYTWNVDATNLKEKMIAEPINAGIISDG